MRLLKGFTIETDKQGNILTNLPYPGFFSFKLDGIRAAYLLENVPHFQSNSGKFFPSKYIRSLGQAGLDIQLDGEWIYGDPSNPNCYSDTFSAVMSIEWPENLDKNKLKFWVFDIIADAPFLQRAIALISLRTKLFQYPWIQFIEQHEIRSKEELKEAYEFALETGFEGIIFRSKFGHYKQGRSTEREGLMGKLKPYGKELFEATIVGYYPMKVALSSELNELGYLKASKASSNVEEVDMLGGFYVRDLATGVEFSLGGGKLFTKQFRIDAWKNVDDFVGKVVQYKCMTYGTVEKPRQPTAVRFRDNVDMTNY